MNFYIIHGFSGSHAVSLSVITVTKYHPWALKLISGNTCFLICFPELIELRGNIDP